MCFKQIPVKVAQKTNKKQEYLLHLARRRINVNKHKFLIN